MVTNRYVPVVPRLELKYYDTSVITRNYTCPLGFVQLSVECHNIKNTKCEIEIIMNVVRGTDLLTDNLIV